MYLSHPVRRIRDDPDPGATVELVVTATDADEETEQSGSEAAQADSDADEGEVEPDDFDSEPNDADSEPGDANGGDLDVLATALEEAGAEVRERLRFGSLRVACPETAVAEICSLEGIESIETGATRELAGGDAGEDL